VLVFFLVASLAHAATAELTVTVPGGQPTSIVLPDAAQAGSLELLLDGAGEEQWMFSFELLALSAGTWQIDFALDAVTTSRRGALRRAEFSRPRVTTLTGQAAHFSVGGGGERAFSIDLLVSEQRPPMGGTNRGL
jgi:hypothetical protein